MIISNDRVRRLVGHLAAVLLAAWCAGVLFARVAPDLPPARLTLVGAPMTSARGLLTVWLPDLPGLATLTPPTVIALEFDNPSASADVDVSLNNFAIARVTLDAGRSTRVDRALPAGLIVRAGDRLQIKARGTRGGSGSRDGSASRDAGGGEWRLTRVELTNLRASARGPFTYYLLPRDGMSDRGMIGGRVLDGIAPDRWTRQPLVLAGCALGVYLLALARRRWTPRAWWLRALSALLLALPLLVFAVAIASGRPWPSILGPSVPGPSVLVLSARTYAWLLGIAFLPALLFACRRGLGLGAERRPRSTGRGQ